MRCFPGVVIVILTVISIPRIFLLCQQPYHVGNFDLRLSAFDFVRICAKHNPVVGFFERTVQARGGHKSRERKRRSVIYSTDQEKRG